jgi:hypothetical protein
MFVGDEVLLEVSFAVARERLAQLAEGSVLIGTSQDAYGRGAVALASTGITGLSELVRVQVREIAWTGRTAGLAIRWEATGSGGGLIPVLDADIRLAPAGEHHRANHGRRVPACARFARKDPGPGELASGRRRDDPQFRRRGGSPDHWPAGRSAGGCP